MQWRRVAKWLWVWLWLWLAFDGQLRREGTHGGRVEERDMFFCVCCVARSDACESEDAG